MKIALRIAAVAPLALALGACADDSAGGKSYSDPAPASASQKANAEAALTGTNDLKTLAKDDPTSTSAVGKVSAIYSNVNALVASKQAAQVQAGAGAGAGVPGMATGGLYAELEAPLDASCVTTDGTKVTYNACDFGTATMNGTIDFQEPTLTLDLQIGISVSGLASTVDYSGTIDVTPTAIVGTLSFSATSDVSGGLGGLAGAGGQSFQTTTTADAVYDVTLADGCATGGNIEIHSVTSVSGGSIPSGSGDQDIWVNLLFGPACGDVQIQ